MTLTLQELSLANAQRQLQWCSNGAVPDLSFRGNELAGEVGEACNIIKKLERERHGWPGSRGTVEQLASELADVVICTSLIANTVDIDLSRAVIDKFNETTDKVGLTVYLGSDSIPPNPRQQLIDCLTEASEKVTSFYGPFSVQRIEFFHLVTRM